MTFTDFTKRCATEYKSSAQLLSVGKVRVGCANFSQLFYIFFSLVKTTLKVL